MSQLLRKALGATTATAIVMTLLANAPAQAGEPDAPSRPTHIAVVAKASGPNHFNSSIKVDLPPGGTAQVTSPTVDKSMKKATVDVSDLADDPAFNEIAVMLHQFPTPGQRVIGCLIAALGALDLGTDAATLENVEANGGEITIVVIFFCLLLAKAVADIKSGSGRVVNAAVPGCAINPLQVKTTLEQTGSGYTMSATPNIKANKKKAKIKVKCKVVGNKRVYTIKPRKKGKSLRSAVGKNLVVGLASPSTASTTAPLKVSFKAP